MRIDHTKLALELKMAVPNRVAAPVGKSDMTVLKSLNGLQRKAFDKAYIAKLGVEGHKEAVAAFETEIEQGRNADLQEEAKRALQTILEHYQMVQDLAAKKGTTAAR